MSPEARAEARRLADQDLKEMPLHEQRTDVYLSTLENFVEAMGGRLEMYAVFPDGKVKLGLEREAS
jgi:hypothetical protein